MKGRYFWIALSLIGMSWIVNSIYAYSTKLEEPIFLDHYIDIDYHDNLFLTFYYLTNKNDTSVIQSIHAGDISGYSEQEHSYLDFQPYNHQSFGSYVLRSVSVKVYNPYGTKLEESFSEMDVVFSDGRVITAPIGHVKMQPPTMDQTPLQFTMGGGSNSNFTQDSYRVLEPLTIESVNHSFEDELKNDLSIKMYTPGNAVESESSFQKSMHGEWENTPGLAVKDVIFPQSLKENDTFRIYSKFPTNSTSILQLNIYTSGQTASGKAFSIVTHVITNPYLEHTDVKNFIKEKTRRSLHE